MTDLSQLRIGVSVKLKGGDILYTKPLPLGWQRVAETNAKPSMGRLATVIRVVGDTRWLPVDLIEEIAL